MKGMKTCKQFLNLKAIHFLHNSPFSIQNWPQCDSLRKIISRDIFVFSQKGKCCIIYGITLKVKNEQFLCYEDFIKRA